MKIAAIQMVSTTDVRTNLLSARLLLDEAAALGAELAVLPEYFCLLGANDTDKLKIKETFGSGPIQEMLAESAVRHKMWVVGGTLPLAIEHVENKIFNTSLVFDPSGRCLARYDKIHLFKFTSGAEHYDESKTLQPGSQPVAFELPSEDGHTWRVGLSICYDLRFPELYRSLANLNTELILVPSAFTFTTGQAHWEVLLRARAIENLAWVAAPAQGGLHENTRRTWGQTMIVSPWGQVTAQKATGPGCTIAEINFQDNVLFRNRLPALEHRVL